MPLEIGWKKDSGPLMADVSVRQYGQYTSSLSINSLTPQHAGNYTCFARNDAATAMYTAQLLVNGKYCPGAIEHWLFLPLVHLCTL